MKKALLLIILLIYIIAPLSAQLLPGQWRDLLAYQMGKKVVVAGNKVFCCTSGSLFYCDKADLNPNKVSKINGLTEVDISTIAYDGQNDAVIIAYANSNIDILQKGKIYNLPFIKNKITIPDRRINEITVVNGKAYLACSFGIVVLDVAKKELDDTYYPALNTTPNIVNNVCFDSVNIYAATVTGIFKANLNDAFLMDYSHWTRLTNFNHYDRECNDIKYFNGKVFALYLNDPGTFNDSVLYTNGQTWEKLDLSSYQHTWIRSFNVANNTLLIVFPYSIVGVNASLKTRIIGSGFYPTYAAMDENNVTWVADRLNALLEFDSNGQRVSITPNSPYAPDVFKMDYFNGRLWTVVGGVTQSWYNMFNNRGCQAYFDDSWHSYNSGNCPELNSVRDLINVKIDRNDPNKVFMSSWSTPGSGLLEYSNGSFNFVKGIMPWILTDNGAMDTLYRMGGLSYDPSGNLWITCYDAKRPLTVMTSSGKMKNYSLGETLPLANVLATSWGHQWMYMTYSTKMVVFDNNQTIDVETDDRHTSLSLANVAELVPSGNILCMVEDKSGALWLGTDAGPVIIDNPQDVFSGSSISIHKLLVQLVKGKTDAVYLLENERINAVAVDGGNRKWIGTQNSGVYLLSSDGQQVLTHFTAENSPLWSNAINDIVIDPKKGEVFFGTDKGIISYRGYATEGGQDFGKVYVFPNPIRPNYNGNIFITGLIEDANVKITDISGNLVYETTALGGQAVWNGKNLLNNRVNTGVYLVFCSNSDGSKTYVTKLLFIH
jgi:hypothetical protein